MESIKVCTTIQTNNKKKNFLIVHGHQKGYFNIRFRLINTSITKHKNKKNNHEVDLKLQSSYRKIEHQTLQPEI